MDRVRRLSAFWAYLPAFRAVAESEHLPSASRALALSPSALSRAVAQLEEALGAPLFDRVGRRIVLNPRGQVFLSAVRHAMRVVHEAELVVEGTAMMGEVSVSCPGPFVAPLLEPALAAMRDEHPNLTPKIVSFPSHALGQALRRGEIDVAVDDALGEPSGLRVHALRPLEHDVFCAPGHPLLATTGAARTTCLAQAEFVAPAAPEGAPSPDGWPSTRSRRVTVRVQRMQAAIDLVRSGTYVAALPRLAAEAHGLVRLHARGLSDTELVVASREPLALPTPGSILADILIRVHS